jgi:hypothetical protein
VQAVVFSIGGDEHALPTGTAPGARGASLAANEQLAGEGAHAACDRAARLGRRASGDTAMWCRR